MKLIQFLLFVALAMLFNDCQLSNGETASKSVQKPTTTALSTQFAERWEIPRSQQFCYLDENPEFSPKKQPMCPASPFSYPPVPFPSIDNPTKEKSLSTNIYPKKESHCLKKDEKVEQNRKLPKKEEDLIEEEVIAKKNLKNADVNKTEDRKNEKNNAKKSDERLKRSKTTTNSSTNINNDMECTVEEEDDNALKIKFEIFPKNIASSAPKSKNAKKFFNETIKVDEFTMPKGKEGNKKGNKKQTKVNDAAEKATLDADVNDAKKEKHKLEKAERLPPKNLESNIKNNEKATKTKTVKNK